MHYLSFLLDFFTHINPKGKSAIAGTADPRIIAPQRSALTIFLFMFFSNFANAIDENGMFSEAAKFTQQGNYSEAEKIYKKLLNGNNPQRAATMLGTIAEEQRKYPEAKMV